ncbi:hypothetical protein D3C78_1583160 [compost metagenome]
MQAAAGQYRQAGSLGQSRGKALTLQAYTRGLVGTPGQVTALASGTKDDDGVRALPQHCPFVAGQRWLALEQAGTPLHHHRQAHQPKTTQPQCKAHTGKPWP